MNLQQCFLAIMAVVPRALVIFKTGVQIVFAQDIAIVFSIEMLSSSFVLFKWAAINVLLAFAMLAIAHLRWSRVCATVRVRARSRA
ncbi:MAG: hypothetical protein ACRDAM_07210 [Casimicrobium sp.]